MNAGCCLLILATTALGQEPDVASVRVAIAKSLPALQAGARSFRERSEGRCIGCHHQGLILQTVALARQNGLPVDESLAAAEKERVYGFYARRHSLYVLAQSDSAAASRADSYGNFNVHVGFWLWGLASEKVPPDGVLADTVRLLASKQSQDGRWSFDDSARAPMQSSDFTTTALAVFVIRHYGSPKDAAIFNPRVAQAYEWMLKSPAQTTDDKAFRLFGLKWSACDNDQRVQAANELLAVQRADGGWAQQENMQSDPYATGLALVALHQAGELGVLQPTFQNGVKYLLNHQHRDGTWYVKTRAIPSNPYFESGFPYGKSQFISYAASCWATQALLLSVSSNTPVDPADSSR